MSPIAANLQAVRRRISEALQGDSRVPTLVAVSKTRPAEAVREAFAAGCRDFGENYVQEAIPKIAALGDLPIAWHFIGALQSNKAAEVAHHFHWFHGLDRLRVAQALSKARLPTQPPLNVCIQVNISHEATKGGIEAAGAAQLAGEIASLPGLKLRGLMGIASPTAEVAQQRREFAQLRAAFDALRLAHPGADTLSMGMSQDLESALAEGATMLRIGTDIFGAREKRTAA